MKKRYWFIILFLLTSKISFAKNCDLFSLANDQKKEIYEILEAQITKSFNDFFKSRNIEFWRDKLFLDLKTGYRPYSSSSNYHYLKVYFFGKTKKKNLLSTRTSILEFPDFENGIIDLNFYKKEERGREGDIISVRCVVSIRDSQIGIYNIKSKNYLIGNLDFGAKIIREFEY